MVSPGEGKRGVTETMSTLSEPMTRIRGGIVVVVVVAVQS